MKSIGISQSGENATLIDKFTERYRPSAFNRELKYIYWICHYHRLNICIGIFLAGSFFVLRAFFVCKTIGNFFFSDRLSDGMGYYRRTLSVGDLVGKKITDKV
jgi:hypothetical protein